MTELRALLWDVDGTLAETERDGHRVAFNLAFDALQIPWRWDETHYGDLLSVTGGIMWWRRRPKGRLGTPPMPADRRLAVGVVVLILALCLFLPMAGVTLLAALVIDALISAGNRLRRKPA